MVAAHIVGDRAGAADLVTSANSAYVHGMGLVLLVCGIASLAAALLAGAFLPNTESRDVTGSMKGKPTPDMAPAPADGRQ